MELIILTNVSIILSLYLILIFINKLEEDLIELVTQREDIKDRIENTKYKKMTFSKDEEANSYILNLEDCQISFDIIEGEDEQGPWFEIECNIIFF